MILDRNNDDMHPDIYWWVLPVPTVASLCMICRTLGVITTYINNHHYHRRRPKYHPIQILHNIFLIPSQITIHNPRWHIVPLLSLFDMPILLIRKIMPAESPPVIAIPSSIFIGTPATSSDPLFPHQFPEKFWYGIHRTLLPSLPPMRMSIRMMAMRYKAIIRKRWHRSNAQICPNHPADVLTDGPPGIGTRIQRCRWKGRHSVVRRGESATHGLIGPGATGGCGSDIGMSSAEGGGGVNALAWDPSHPFRLASASDNDTVQLWDICKAGSAAYLGVLNREKEVGSLHSSDVYHEWMAMHP